MVVLLQTFTYKQYFHDSMVQAQKGMMLWLDVISLNMEQM